MNLIIDETFCEIRSIGILIFIFMSTFRQHLCHLHHTYTTRYCILYTKVVFGVYNNSSYECSEEDNKFCRNGDIKIYFDPLILTKLSH